MDAATLEETFKSIMPESVFRSAIKATGFQERQRKLDAHRLLRAMVISASTGYGADRPM